MTEEARKAVEALRICHSNEDCRDCKFIDSDKDETSCVNVLFVKAADLIESLSAENEILNAAIGQLGTIECHRDMLEHELEQVTRERDAAIRDIDEAAPCFACIRFERNGGDCIGAHVCIDDILQDALGGKYADYYWQWRGVEVTDNAQKRSDAKS